MTTITYKDGVMACDSCWSYDDGMDTQQTKVIRLKSGALLGGAGDNDARDIVALLDNVKIPSRLPTKTQLLAVRCDYLGLLVLPKGRVYKVASTHVSEANWSKEFDEDIGIWEISGPFTAIGTGSRWAMGAMEAGRHAADACRIAAKYDLNSKPPIYSYQLTLAKKKVK